jgi:hypothetical protein
MARVKPEEPRITTDDVVAQTREYVYIKSQLEALEKQQKELRAKLFDRLDQDGEFDGSGNITLDLPEAADSIRMLVKQARVSRKIDMNKAEEIIEQKGLQDKLYKTIRVIDEDALMAALYSDELTEDELDEIYPKHTIWALVLKK